jgi:hypothetical protein
MATTDLRGVDPVFIEVCKQVYGPGVDVREIWDISKMGDSSEVHVLGNNKRVSVAHLRKGGLVPPKRGEVIKNTQAQQDGNRKKLAGGLLFGAGAEGLAVRGAANAVRNAPTSVEHAPGIKSALKAVPHTKTGKAAELGIQAVNFGVGLAAARELLKKPKKATVAKAKVPFRHISPEVIRAANGRARRNGLRAVGATATTAAGGAGYALGRRQGATVPPAIPAIPKAPVQKNKRENVHYAGETANGVAGGAGAIFGAAKIRDLYRDDRKANPAKLANAAQGVAAKGSKLGLKPAAAGQLAHALERGRPGLRTTVVGAVAGGAGAGLHRYGQHLDRVKAKQNHQAVAKGMVDVEVRGIISKINEEKRQVFGWANLSVVDGKPVIDLQGDFVDIEEIEKSAYSYVLNSRVGGDMHARISKFATAPVHTADMIESVVITPEKLEAWNLAPDALPLGWWVGYHVNDDQQWQDVKSGKRIGFSIHGTGQRRQMAAA